MKNIKRLSLFTAFLCLGLSPVKAFFGLQEEPVVAKYSTTGLTASTHVVVIDLSDTANYPHKFTGAINVMALRISVDKIATSSGTIKIGVVSGCSVSIGTVTYFAELTYDRSAAGTEVVGNWVYNSGFVRTKVDSNEATPYIASNDRLLASTAFQTDVVLPSIPGNSAPGKGDIVLTYTASGSGATDISVEVVYNSERP